MLGDAPQETSCGLYTAILTVDSFSLALKLLHNAHSHSLLHCSMYSVLTALVSQVCLLIF